MLGRIRPECRGLDIVDLNHVFLEDFKLKIFIAHEQLWNMYLSLFFFIYM